jgi:NAD+ dependent glucose-6-phosphate dehydrogenase
MNGGEVTVHLAEDPDQNAPHRQVLENNMQATWNVFHGAATHKVRRVVYASSNWVVKLLEEQLSPGCYSECGQKITSDAYPRPKNPYGIGKAFGELTGKCYIDTGHLDSFLAVRMGCFDPSQPRNQLSSPLQITAHDLRSLFRRCVEASFTGLHVIYGVSGSKRDPMIYLTRGITRLGTKLVAQMNLIGVKIFRVSGIFMGSNAP